VSAGVVSGGARVGRPASAAIVGGYFALALGCWVAAGVALVAAARPLALGGVAEPRVLLAVHLVALGFLPPAVAGGALHILPTLLRTDACRWRAAAALPLLCAGPALAAGIARHLEPLLWPAASVEAAGVALVAWEVLALALRAPGDRMLLTSRVGVALSALHAVAALVVGGVLAAREWRPVVGIPHERVIAIHLHLAIVGWLTLLLLTVGRTLGPMLALAPAAPRRRLPVEELVLVAGLWLLLAGLGAGVRSAETAGGLLALVAIVRFAAIIARVAREQRVAAPEAPLVHVGAGLVFLAQAAVLGLGMTLGLAVTPRRLTAYVVALLIGWAAGATVGHVGKLLSLAAWTWWPPGPRPKQAELYPRRLWTGEAVAFAVGVELVVDGALAGSPVPVAAGAALVLVSAAVAAVAAALTLRAGRPALRPRPA